MNKEQIESQLSEIYSHVSQKTYDAAQWISNHMMETTPESQMQIYVDDDMRGVIEVIYVDEWDDMEIKTTIVLDDNFLPAITLKITHDVANYKEMANDPIQNL